MDAIELPIRPTFDPTAIEKAIAQFKELEAKGFTIPINFVGNLETIKADAEALIAKLRGQWQGLASDLSQGNNKLLLELDRLGESTAAARLRAGFVSVQEEVLVLDNLISELNLKGNPGAGLAKGLAGGRIADLAKSGQAAGDTVSFAGYGESAEKATAAQAKFTAAEAQGAGVARQSEAAIGAESAALRAKAMQFESAGAASKKFQIAEEQQTAQTQRAARVIGDTSGSAEALQRQRSAALIQAGGSDPALQRQRSAALLAEQKRSASEQAAEQQRQQSAQEALQRQRSAALIRQAKEEERSQSTSGFKGILNTVGTAGTFIATYGAIDLAVRALKAGAEASVEFERKMATLQIIFHGTKEEANALGHAVLEQAAALGQDGIKALEVATDFARFGLTQAEVLEAVRVSLVAANVAQLDLATSGKYLQTIFAGYQLNVGQLAGVLGSLDTVSHSTNVSNTQLLEGLARVAPLAKQAGIGLNELIGFEAVISSRTSRPGAEAGNALKSLLSRFEKPATQSTLEAVGVTFKDDKGDFKSRSDVIRQLYERYQTLTKSEQEELLIAVAGTQQASRIAALLDGYAKAEELAIMAARDFGRAERENIAVRETLSSQLGTLKTRWEQFWVAGSGAGQANSVQSHISAIVKLISNLLQVLAGAGTVIGKFGNAADAGLKNTFGDSAGGKLSTGLGLAISGGAKPITTAIDKFQEAYPHLFDFFKSNTEKADEALIKFNSHIGELLQLSNADASSVNLFGTVSQQITTANDEQAKALIQAAASAGAGIGSTGGGATPEQLKKQRALQNELSLMKEQGDVAGIQARLAGLAAAAAADGAKFTKQSEEELAKAVGHQQALVAVAKSAADALAAKGDVTGYEKANIALQEAEGLLGRYREQVRQAKGERSGFSFNEDDQWNISEIKLKGRAAAAAAAAKELGSDIGKTTRVDQLNTELQLAQLQYDIAKATVQEHSKDVEEAGKLLQVLNQQLKATQEKVAAEMRYVPILESIDIGRRKISNEIAGAGEVNAAIPTVNRADEVGRQLALNAAENEQLNILRAQTDVKMLTAGGHQQELDIIRKVITSRQYELGLAKEKLESELRFAAAVEAAKQGVKDAQATNEFFGGVGKNETEKKANLIHNLTSPKSDRDPLTGLPLNISAARSDLAGASNQIEQAQALARLKEFGISLQNAENDLVRRRFQIEAEITNERRKQAEEASKNLIMGDRETQLRAALAAKFAAERGGKGFSANEFMFLDQKTKQGIERTNPELLPPELKNKLHELQDESTGLAAAFKPLKEAADGAAKAIANLHLPTPALNPGGPGGVPVGIDLAPVSSAIDSSGHGVQTAIEVLGTKMSGHLDAFAGALESISAGLDFRISRLESGSATSRIGRAQGAASVLA